MDEMIDIYLIKVTYEMNADDGISFRNCLEGK
jgi:hypothetical protein